MWPYTAQKNYGRMTHSRDGQTPGHAGRGDACRNPRQASWSRSTYPLSMLIYCHCRLREVLHLGVP
jgi:hypothetical protein